LLFEYRRSTGRAQRIFDQAATFSTRSDPNQFLDKRTKQTPEVIFTGIAANALNLLALSTSTKSKESVQT